MKNLLKFVLISFVFISCSHDIMDELEEELDINETEATLLYDGNFMSANNYTVSGKAEVIEIDDKKMLIFKSFSSSSGPDLKVFVSEELKPTNHLNLGDLKALSGTFSYELPSNFDLSQNGSHVLIYCERFSVLFGSVELKPNTN